MATQKIIIDNSTQAKELDANTIQLDLVAYPYNESNQKEPDAEFRIFINNQLLQNLNSDMQGNIKENLIIRGNHEKIIIKLQDTKSGTVSDIKEIFLKGNKEEKKETNNDFERAKYIIQLKIDPNNITKLPERARNDPEIVKYALEQNGAFLWNVGESIKNDKKMVMLAIHQNPDAFLYISDELKTDEEFVMECIKKYGTIIINYLSYYMLSRPNIKNQITNILDILKQKKEILENIRNKLPNDHIYKYDTINTSSLLGSEYFRIEQMYKSHNTYELRSVNSARVINQANTIIEKQK